MRKDGTRCTRAVGEGEDGVCIFHSTRRTEWRIAGGQHSRRGQKAMRLLPTRLRPIVDLLMQAMDEVHSGALAPSQASAMASLAGAIVRTFTAGEVEERLRELERRADVATQEQPWNAS
jgi:hypothetical protein